MLTNYWHWHQKLEIDAPALEYFDLHGPIPLEFSIQPLPLVAQANVGLCYHLLQALGEVKSLNFVKWYSPDAVAWICCKIYLRAQKICKFLSLRRIYIITCWSKLEHHVPKCLSSRITIISIAILDKYYIDELPVIGYILKHAGVLERLVINPGYLGCGERLSLLKNMASFPRRSEKCQVTFY
ncbi:hypothetical protein ACH5RR_028063 [Cinchona calisaya]|uniref:FBD domain-containing protein n=1 Tax=Cinchona calisaya TaxID=153742 RepID=A0ABD2YMQ5_9GENT